jgi:hypothetical protein
MSLGPQTPEQPSGFRLHLWMALLGAALFSMESWVFGPRSWMYGYGGGLETVPTYLALSFPDRNFSLWSPFVGGGLPRLAFWGNAAPLSPEQFLFTVLPTWLAYGLHRYLQYFIAIFFAARVCEEQLGLDRRFSGLAGWFHASFAYLTTGALLAIPGVPLLAWLLARITTPSSGLGAAVLCGLAMSFTTTFTFGVPYLLVFAFFWLFAVRATRTWHGVRQFLVFGVVLAVAECPQLLAVMANAPRSHRAGWPGEALPFSIDGLFYRQLQFDLFAQSPILSSITLNLPGIAFLVGLPLLLVASRLRPDLRPVCWVGTRVFLLYGLVSQKWLWLFLQGGVSKLFPWAMGVYMGRFYEVPAAFLIACMLTLVCYVGWHLLPAWRPVHMAAAAAVVAFIGFMMVWPKVHLFYPLGVEDWGEKNFRIAALEEIKQREQEPFRVASVLPLQPAYAYAQGLECADGWANLFPAVYRDLWLRVLTPELTRLPRVKNIFDPDTGKPQDNYIFLGADLIQPGIGVLPGEDTMRCLQEGFDVQPRFNLDLLRLLNVKYLLSEYPLKGAGLCLVHAPAAPPTFPQSRDYATGLMNGPRPPRASRQSGFVGRLQSAGADFKEAMKRKCQEKDLFIYEVLGCLPRFRFVEEVAVEPDGKAVLDRLASFDAVMHSRCAVMQEADAESLTPRQRFAAGTVRLTSYSCDTIELEIATSGEGFLVIANTWDPSWRAEVDGQPRPLLRVNHAQFGILIHAGDDRIRLIYAPPYAPLSVLAQPAPRHVEGNERRES